MREAIRELWGVVKEAAYWLTQIGGEYTLQDWLDNCHDCIKWWVLAYPLNR
jgi:hypothetical protein